MYMGLYMHYVRVHQLVAVRGACAAMGLNMHTHIFCKRISVHIHAVRGRMNTRSLLLAGTTVQLQVPPRASAARRKVLGHNSSGQGRTH